MQGNERNSDMIDPQFMDHAWTEMSKKLDQEMPIPNAPSSKNHRSYGLLLLFLLIGFASGIGTMVFFQSPKTDTIEKKPALNYDPSKVAQIDNNAVNMNAAETDQLASVNQSNKNIEQRIKEKLSKPTISKSKQGNSAIYDNKLYNNSSSVIAFNQESLNTNSKLNEDQPLISTGLPKVNTFELRSKNESLNSFDNRNEQIAALDLLTTSELSLLEIPNKEIVMNLQLTNSAPRLSYGIYLGTQTRDFDGMDGLSAGLYASYRLDRKFSIRSGLGYSLITGFQLESLGIADPLTPAFFEPIEVVDLQSYSTVAAIGNNQDLPIQGLHYIDVPIALDYRMSGKFGILMGMKFSYLLNAKTDGYFSKNLSAEEAEQLDIALYNSMKKMDIGTILGLGIYPSNRVGVELKYNHGLIDYTIDEKWHVRQLNTNKTFELSFNYLLR